MPLQVGVLEPAGTTSPQGVMQPEGGHEHSKDSEDAHTSPLGIADAEHTVPHGHQPSGGPIIDRTPLLAATGIETAGMYDLDFL